MKKLILISTVLFLLMFSLTGCGSKNEKTSAENTAKTAATTASSQQTELFTVNSPTQTGVTDVLIADAKGFFKEQGIKINYVGIVKPATSIPAMLKGEIDFNLGHPDALGKAILAGSKVKAISTGMIDDPKAPHLIYFVPKGSPIKTAQDLIGKKIGVPFSGTCPDGYIIEWLRQNNITRDKVQFVVIPEPQLELALKKGLVDAAGYHPAFYQSLLNKPELFDVLINTWQIAKNPDMGSSFSAIVSEKFLQEHPDVAKGIVKALHKAHHWMNANNEEAKNIGSKILKRPAKDLALFHYDDVDYIQDQRIEPWFMMMIDNGFLKPGQLKPTDIYTNDYNPDYKK